MPNVWSTPSVGIKVLSDTADIPPAADKPLFCKVAFWLPYVMVSDIVENPSSLSPSPSPVATGAPRLLDLVRERLRLKHYSVRTEKAYLGWIRRYIIHHGRRHPANMGRREVEAFLTSLAVERDVSAATQGQALSAILFLYREVLEQPLPWLDEVTRAKRPARLPSVLLRAEVQRLIAAADDPLNLIVSLLH
ncbi:phage integrase N-terminal SAM-like domain-containing protein [Aromatoleum bremense]